MATVKNKDLIQSYIITTAKYDFSVYEKRILYRIIELNQDLLEGKKLNEKHRVDNTIYGDKIYTIPIKSFLKDENDDNYKEVKKALERLKRKEITYEDGTVWASLTIIANPKIRKYSDTVTFMVDSIIYNALLDFSKGYRKLEIKTAMSFESVYSMRFYELMSGQKTPIPYGIEKLKEMFKITDKYNKVNDFIRFVIEPAKRELDRCSPYTFEYEMNKTGRKFTSVTLYPKIQPEHRDHELEQIELQKQMSLSWYLDKKTRDYLKHGLNFSTKEIKNNIDLFRRAQGQISNFVNELSLLKEKSIGKKNPKGYVINSLRGKLDDRETTPEQRNIQSMIENAASKLSSR